MVCELHFLMSRSPPNQARKFTQILAVLAVSFGCFIHGTTVAYPALFLPSLRKSNGTIEPRNQSDDVAARDNDSSTSTAMFPEKLPFYIYQEDESLIGETEKQNDRHGSIT